MSMERVRITLGQVRMESRDTSELQQAQLAWMDAVTGRLTELENLLERLTGIVEKDVQARLEAQSGGIRTVVPTLGAEEMRGIPTWPEGVTATVKYVCPAGYSGDEQCFGCPEGCKRRGAT